MWRSLLLQLPFCLPTEPFDVRIKQPDDENLEFGELQARRAFAILEQCVATGEWPGYDGFSDNVTWGRMPEWARKRIRKELELDNG